MLEGLGHEGVGQGCEDRPGEGESDGQYLLVEAPARSRPSTTAIASSAAAPAHVLVANRPLRPSSRIATAPTSDSGRLEAKIATRRVRLACSASDTPSARFSGTPSSVTAASRAQPTPRAAPPPAVSRASAPGLPAT